LFFAASYCAVTPRHILSAADGSILSGPESPPVRDLEGEGPDGVVRRWISMPAPNQLGFRIRVEPSWPHPARYRLRGEASVRKEALVDGVFAERSDGFTARVILNDTDAFSAYLAPGHAFFRYFDIELPEGEELDLGLVTGAGPHANAELDWAVYKWVRIEPVFTRAFLVSLGAIIAGAAMLLVRRPRDEVAPEAAGRPDRHAIPPARKAIYAGAVTLLFTWVALEAGYPRIARTALFVKLFPALVPPGLAHYEESPDWRHDPELGFARRPGLHLEYEFKDGDIHHMGLTSIRRRESSAVVFSTDRRGFRETTPPDQAAIAVLGDSFVEGANVVRPLPDLLEDRLGAPTYNLGVACYGTLQEELLIKRMARELSSLQVVVLVYHGGNDHTDSLEFSRRRESKDLIAGYDGILRARRTVEARAREFPMEKRLAGRLLLWLWPSIGGLSERADRVGLVPPEKTVKPDAARDDLAPYPFSSSEAAARNAFPVRLASGQSTIALLPSNLEDAFRDDREREEAARLGRQAVGSIYDFLSERDIKLLVCHMPTKFAVYASAIRESFPGDKEFGEAILPLSNLWDGERPEELARRLVSNSGRAGEELEAYCRSKGVPFLDLETGLSRAADDRLVYFTNDTHLNQFGHEVVADLIAERMNRGL